MFFIAFVALMYWVLLFFVVVDKVCMYGCEFKKTSIAETGGVI